jgi:hypothetical protein
MQSDPLRLTGEIIQPIRVRTGLRALASGIAGPSKKSSFPTMRASAKFGLMTAVVLAGVATWSIRWKPVGRDAPSRAVSTGSDRSKAAALPPMAPRPPGKTIPSEQERPIPKSIETARDTPELNSPDLAARWLAAAENSHFVNIRIAQTTQLTLETFADFFAQAGLTAEQINHLAVLLAEKRLGATNVAIAQLRQGIVPDPESPAFLADLTAERSRADQEIKAYLGEEHFRELESYLRAREEDAVFTRLGRVISDTPDALTDSQTEQLKQVLRDEPGARLSPEAIARASRFLSGPQVKALQEAYAAQEEIFRQRNRQALPSRPTP